MTGMSHEQRLKLILKRLIKARERAGLSQSQDKLMEAHNSSVNTLRDRMLKQEQDEIAQEAWLRERDHLRDFKSRVEQIVRTFDDYADRVDRNNRLEIMETALRDLASGKSE